MPEFRSVTSITVFLGISVLFFSSGASFEPETGSQLRQDWPCNECLFQEPPQLDPDEPTPFMVLFHGDENDPGYVFHSYRQTASDYGFLLLAIKCPVERGCPEESVQGVWLKWAGADPEHVEWIESLVVAVEARYNVDSKRIYLGSFSGGSYFLADYTVKELPARRYAGGVWTGGGMRPGLPCPEACQMPAYFLMGGEDTNTNAQKNYDYLLECGHDVVWNELEGVPHEVPVDHLPTVFDWLLERPNQCTEDDDDDDDDNDNDNNANDNNDDDNNDNGDDDNDDNNDDDSGDDDDESDDDDNDEDEEPDDNADSGSSGGCSFVVSSPRPALLPPFHFLDTSITP